MPKSPPHHVLLLGQEEGEKSIWIDQYRKDIQKTAGGEIEEFRYYAFELNMTEFIGFARTDSLFNPVRLFVINDVNEIKKKDDISLLKDYLENPSPSTYIAFTSTQTKLDKSLQTALDKGIPKDGVKIFWELFENQKKGLITGELSRAGIGIESDALEFFLETVDNDSTSLRKQCQVLIGQHQSGSTITLEDLEGFLYHSREENVFSLFAVIARKDLAASLDILQTILLSQTGDAHSLPMGLLWQFERLLHIKLLQADRVPLPQAMDQSQIRGKRQQATYSDAARRFTLDEVKRAIILTKELIGVVRSSKQDMHSIFLELFLYSCITGTGTELLIS